MRRAPLASLLAVWALTLAGVVPTALASPGGRPAGPPVARASRADGASRADRESVTALRTLHEVEEVRAGNAPPTQPGGLAGGRDLTLLLRDLRVQLDALSGRQQARARSLLARPTDGPGADDGYRTRARNDCGRGKPGAGTHFCIHWVEKTADRPPLADTRPANGIPDQVDRTRETMQHVWKREIRAAGYRAPRRDAGPPRAGPNRKLDIYLAEIGDVGLYGYCASESVPDGGRDAAAFCVLDNDYVFREFPFHTPLQNLQVTAAHEFFHAVQFGYDEREDAWLMEGTATWMEDEIYDAVDDNRIYLGESPLTSPTRPLDQGVTPWFYGTWVWWRYLTERSPRSRGTGIPTLVRRVWEEADDADPDRPGTYSLAALRRVLAHRGSSLTKELAGFAVANRRPGSFYEEGGRYPVAPLASSNRLSETRPTLPERVVRIDHLASQTVAFTPDAGLATGGWRLRAQVDLPSARHSPVAQLTTVRTDGTVTTERIRVDRDGVGRATVGFDSDVVARVELTLTNAGHRFACHRGSELSCRGVSKSNDRQFAYSVGLTR